MDGAAALLGCTVVARITERPGAKARPTRPWPATSRLARPFGRDFHDAAGAGERGGNIEIAIDVEGQSLRPSQAFVERGHALRWDRFCRRGRWDR